MDFTKMPKSVWFSLDRLPLTLTPRPAEPESFSGISKVRNSCVPSGVNTMSFSSGCGYEKKEKRHVFYIVLHESALTYLSWPKHGHTALSILGRWLNFPPKVGKLLLRPNTMSLLHSKGCVKCNFTLVKRQINKEQNKKKRKKIIDTSGTKIERRGMVNDKKMESRQETR